MKGKSRLLTEEYAGYTEQTINLLMEFGVDVIINAKGVTVGVELKENPGAAFGSAPYSTVMDGN